MLRIGLALAFLLLLCPLGSHAQNTYHKWFPGSVTFYGGHGGGGTLGGACAYSNVNSFGVGVWNAAAASFLWKKGKGCGACYEVKCNPNKNRREFCRIGRTVKVTVTNMCPRGGLGWCNPPRRHLDMSMPAFLEIAIYRAGYVNAFLKRIPCKRQGKIHFRIGGNPWFLTVVISNVAGFAEIRNVYVQVNKPGRTWYTMRQNWGAMYSRSKRFYQLPLNFKIVLLNGQSIFIRNAIPAGWRIGATYFAGQFSSGRSDGNREHGNRRLNALPDGEHAAEGETLNAQLSETVEGIASVSENPILLKEEHRRGEHKGHHGHHHGHHYGRHNQSLSLAEKVAALQKVESQLNRKMEEARKVLEDSKAASESLKAIREQMTATQASVEEIEVRDNARMETVDQLSSEGMKLQTQIPEI